MMTPYHVPVTIGRHVHVEDDPLPVTIDPLPVTIG